MTVPKLPPVPLPWRPLTEDEIWASDAIMGANGRSVRGRGMNVREACLALTLARKWGTFNHGPPNRESCR